MVIHLLLGKMQKFLDLKSHLTKPRIRPWQTFGVFGKHDWARISDRKSTLGTYLLPKLHTSRIRHHIRRLSPNSSRPRGRDGVYGTNARHIWSKSFSGPGNWKNSKNTAEKIENFSMEKIVLLGRAIFCHPEPNDVLLSERLKFGGHSDENWQFECQWCQTCRHVDGHFSYKTHLEKDWGKGDLHYPCRRDRGYAKADIGKGGQFQRGFIHVLRPPENESHRNNDQQQVVIFMFLPTLEYWRQIVTHWILGNVLTTESYELMYQTWHRYRKKTPIFIIWIYIRTVCMKVFNFINNDVTSVWYEFSNNFPSVTNITLIIPKNRTLSESSQISDSAGSHPIRIRPDRIGFQKHSFHWSNYVHAHS